MHSAHAVYYLPVLHIISRSVVRWTDGHNQHNHTHWQVVRVLNAFSFPFFGLVDAAAREPKYTYSRYSIRELVFGLIPVLLFVFCLRARRFRCAHRRYWIVEISAFIWQMEWNSSLSLSGSTAETFVVNTRTQDPSGRLECERVCAYRPCIGR